MKIQFGTKQPTPKSGNSGTTKPTGKPNPPRN
jgi:hypothetical protein